jgi:D-threo-aldose 1-dehydrogenase
VRKIAHLDDTIEKMTVPIPDGLWDELRSEGLLHPQAPTPTIG